jgi:hypothetical protein
LRRSFGQCRQLGILRRREQRPCHHHLLKIDWSNASV